MESVIKQIETMLLQRYTQMQEFRPYNSYTHRTYIFLFSTTWLCHLYRLGAPKTFLGRFGIFQLDGILALELSYCLDSASKDSAPVRDENFHPVFSMKLSSIKFSEEGVLLTSGLLVASLPAADPQSRVTWPLVARSALSVVLHHLYNH